MSIITVSGICRTDPIVKVLNIRQVSNIQWLLLAQGGIQCAKQEHVLHPDPDFFIKVYGNAPDRYTLILVLLDHEFHPDP